MTQRWIVETVPLAKVEAACKARGMQPDDGSSFWDWCEPHDYEIRQEAPTFVAALHKARRLAKNDVWRMPRIFLQSSETDKYGRTEWSDVAFWEVGEGTNRHSDPDHTL